MRKFRKLTVLSILLYCVSALSLSAIPLTELPDGKLSRPGSLAVGLAFWVCGLLATVVWSITAITFKKHRHMAYRKGFLQPQRLPGILTFSRGGAVALYAVILVGAVLLASDLIRHWLPDWIVFPLLSLTLIAVVLHAFLDGKNYKAYISLKEGMKNGEK